MKNTNNLVSDKTTDSILNTVLRASVWFKNTEKQRKENVRKQIQVAIQNKKSDKYISFLKKSLKKLYRDVDYSSLETIYLHQKDTPPSVAGRRVNLRHFKSEQTYEDFTHFNENSYEKYKKGRILFQGITPDKQVTKNFTYPGWRIYPEDTNIPLTIPVLENEDDFFTTKKEQSSPEDPGDFIKNTTLGFVCALAWAGKSQFPRFYNGGYQTARAGIIIDCDNEDGLYMPAELITSEIERDMGILPFSQIIHYKKGKAPHCQVFYLFDRPWNITKEKNWLLYHLVAKCLSNHYHGDPCCTQGIAQNPFFFQGPGAWDAWDKKSPYEAYIFKNLISFEDLAKKLMERYPEEFKEIATEEGKKKIQKEVKKDEEKTSIILNQLHGASAKGLDWSQIADVRKASRNTAIFIAAQKAFNEAIQSLRTNNPQDHQKEIINYIENKYDYTWATAEKGARNFSKKEYHQTIANVVNYFITTWDPSKRIGACFTADQRKQGAEVNKVLHSLQKKGMSLRATEGSLVEFLTADKETCNEFITAFKYLIHYNHMENGEILEVSAMKIFESKIRCELWESIKNHLSNAGISLEDEGCVFDYIIRSLSEALKARIKFNKQSLREYLGLSILDVKLLLSAFNLSSDIKQILLEESGPPGIPPDT